MKNKNKIIFGLLFVFNFFACINPVEIEPPTLTVLPDTIQPISPIDEAVFEIQGFSEEDLTEFTIRTEPNIYSFDTAFGGFAHLLNKTLKLYAPENLPISEDSLIQITFTLANTEKQVSVVRQMKLREGYPPLIHKKITLTYQQDSNFFYSLKSLMPMNCNNVSDDLNDLIFFYTAEDGFSFGSADAKYAAEVVNEDFCGYATLNKNHTALNYISIEPTDITPKLVYEITFAEHYLKEIPENGSGITDLAVGKMVIFKESKGKKGLIYIQSIDNQQNKITFDLYIQKFAVN